MRKLERFYEWVAGRIDGRRQVGMCRAVLETPRSEMADFELALGMFKLHDNPDLLWECLKMGGLEHWRRVKIRARWNAIQEEAVARWDAQWAARAELEKATDAAADRIVDTQWVKEVPK